MVPDDNVVEPTGEGDVSLPTGGDTKKGDLDAKGAPTFDPNAALPADILPQSLASLQGKPLKDVLDSHGNLRSELTKQTEQVKKLEAELEKAKKATTADKTPQQLAEEAKAAMVSTDEYRSAQRLYIETGEVPSEFVEAAEHRGVLVPPEALLDFFEFQKGRTEQFVTALQTHAGEGVNVVEVLQWMGSDGSPYGPEEVRAFDKLTAKKNLSWFDTVKEEFEEARAAGYKPQMPGRFGGGDRLRAHPAPVTEPADFKDTADFQAQLLEIDNDMKLSTAQRKEKRNKLIQRRAKQKGETVKT